MSVATASIEPAPPQPWGIWATLFWAAGTFLVTNIVMSIVLIVFGAFSIDEAASVRYDGYIISLVEVVTVPIIVGVMAWAAHLRRWSPAEYLGLTLPRGGDVVLGFACTAVLLVLFELASHAAGYDPVSIFQIDTYSSARTRNTLPLLWIAFVVFAPLGEEIVFRGFLFRGWVRSPRDLAPAIVVIAVLWSALHFQYQWFEVAQVFTIGLLFGWLRWRSGSTLLTFLLHAFMNAAAMVETMLRF